MLYLDAFWSCVYAKGSKVQYLVASLNEFDRNLSPGSFVQCKLDETECAAIEVSYLHNHANGKLSNLNTGVAPKPIAWLGNYLRVWSFSLPFGILDALLKALAAAMHSFLTQFGLA